MVNILNKPYGKSSNIDSEHLKQSLYHVLERKDLGFLDLVHRKNLWESSDQLSKRIHADYENIVLVGFGGSSMSARALAEMTYSKNISFLDNVDINDNIKILNSVPNLQKTAWIFISKSGNTIEVLALIDLIHQILTEKKIEFWKNSFYVTEQKQSPLFDLSKKHDRPCLELPLDVGGRFSFLSPAGLLMAGLCGLNLDQIKDGAKQALSDKESLLDISYQYLASFNDHRNISLFWFYNSSMRWFGGWLQQLWAESLGKKYDRKNNQAHGFSTPMVAIGSSDQHSILQQVMDGTKNKFVTFFRFDHIENFDFKLENTLFDETLCLRNKKYGALIKAQAEGTAEALESAGTTQMTLKINNLNEINLGYLFMYFQLIVATVAEYHDVNAFDQPGVQLGKVKTIERLSI